MIKLSPAAPFDSGRATTLYPPRCPVGDDPKLKNYDENATYIVVKKEKRPRRKCLSCNRLFFAEGNFNRVCRECKKRDAFMYLEDDFVIRR